MPRTEPSSSAWYSPEPACSAAGSRIESRTAKAAAAIAISEIAIARSSRRSAPETSVTGSFQFQTSRPAVVASAISVSPGALRRSGWLTAEISTTQTATVRAMIGESAA